MDEKFITGVIREHSKASEKYIDVTFKYGDCGFSTCVPTEYRRTGLELSQDEVGDYLESIHSELTPEKRGVWWEEQERFWAKEKKGAATTKSFFDALKSFEWECGDCSFVANPNRARRIQDIKEMGYTLSTDPKRVCGKCSKKTAHFILLPIPRGGASGYETWSPELRDRIVNLLNRFDAYEAKVVSKFSLLPDHKFPEIRWDLETRRESLDDLSDDDIKRDFQLINNQRNQQKREVCRKCKQEGKRGFPYGIPYFYEGGLDWDKDINQKGKESEKGCVGCGWYDLNKWRESLIEEINPSGD